MWRPDRGGDAIEDQVETEVEVGLFRVVRRSPAAICSFSARWCRTA
ncbi:hypothetical protein [Micromonospora avicenniae]|nr:hypothetical protein [Micromonospora avicenniae]